MIHRPIIPKLDHYAQDVVYGSRTWGIPIPANIRGYAMFSPVNLRQHVADEILLRVVVEMEGGQHAKR